MRSTESRQVLLLHFCHHIVARWINLDVVANIYYLCWAVTPCCSWNKPLLHNHLHVFFFISLHSRHSFISTSLWLSLFPWRCKDKEMNNFYIKSLRSDSLSTRIFQDFRSNQILDLTSGWCEHEPGADWSVRRRKDLIHPAKSKFKHGSRSQKLPDHHVLSWQHTVVSHQIIAIKV